MKTIKTLLLGAVLGAGLTSGIMFIGTRPVSKFADTKTSKGASRGCLIQEPFSGKDLSLVFYGQVGRITIDLPQLSLDRVVSHRWLGANRALHLDLLITCHDSAPSTSRVEIVYDFESGQIFVVSGMTLWRSWNVINGDIARYWMTDEELVSVIKRLNSESPRAEQVAAPNGP